MMNSSYEKQLEIPSFKPKINSNLKIERIVNDKPTNVYDYLYQSAEVQRDRKEKVNTFLF